MQARRAFRQFAAPSLTLAFCALSSLLLALSPLPASAQEPGQESAEEIVANLCTGRVVIGVAKDGIVVATLENPIEPQTRPPMIVQLSEDRVAVLLGAADWWLPDQNREIARLDQELPDLPPPDGLNTMPRLQVGEQEGAGSEASDVEQIADRLRSRLASIAEHIHGNLNLAPGEPLLQMVLADYAPSYGPEVWLIQYSLEQEPEQGDYWTTRVLQPKYTQLWPPEKGQPRGLIEVSYPASPPLAGLIRAGDPHVAQSIASAAGMEEVSASILDGGIQKLNAVDLAAFLRACLGAWVTPKARMEEAEVNKVRGVGWFIQPPAQPQLAGSEQARPSGAPTLRHPN
jgi:hypothetical protein